MNELSDNQIKMFEIATYNSALEDAENRYIKWLKSEYGKEADDDMLTIRVLRSLKIKSLGE